MSDYERNKGKLIPFELTEDVAKEFVLSKESALSKEYYDTFLEQALDDLGYYSNYSIERVGDKFYSVQWEVQGGSDYNPEFADVNKNEDGTIDFHTYHYNGGAHWTEIVEEALNV